jgi:hypothetical protein
MASALFYIGSLLTGFNWFFFVFLPFSSISQFLRRTMIVPALAGVIHLWLMIQFAMSGTPVSISSLEAMMKMNLNEHWVLACWIHLTAYDLFALAWVTQDIEKRKIQYIKAFPLVLAIASVGPSILPIYFALRNLLTPKAS